MHDYALRYASLCGHKEIVLLLLDRGANIHADNDGALRAAYKYGNNKEVVELHLARGAQYFL